MDYKMWESHAINEEDEIANNMKEGKRHMNIRVSKYTLLLTI